MSLWSQKTWLFADNGGFAHCAHSARYLNNFSRKWATLEDLANTVPWWRLLREELWQGVRAPLGKVTCKQCSNTLKENKITALPTREHYKGHSTCRS